MSEFYEKYAEWWPLFSPAEDYAEEAEDIRRTLDAACAPRTVLELGSGGGHNAVHLKAHYQLTLSDLATGMLDASRRLNPECEHVQGDMRTLRLGRTFDAVLVHDAIGYMVTEEDLRAAVKTVFTHCRPGGAALLLPDAVTETFEEATEHGGSNDGPRGFRYLEWTHDPDPSDSQVMTEYVFLMRHPDGHVDCLHERHTFGLFSRDVWLRVLREEGFDPTVRTDAWGREVFLARRTR